MANNAHQNVDMRREGKCIWPFCCATAPWLNVLYQRINSTPTKVLLSQRPQCLWKNQSFQSFPQLWDRLISCGSLFIQGHQVRLWLPWILQSYPSFLHLIFDSVSFELQFGPSSFLLHKKFPYKEQIMWSVNPWFFCADRWCRIIQIRDSLFAKSLQAKCSLTFFQIKRHCLNTFNPSYHISDIWDTKLLTDILLAKCKTFVYKM